jgi:TFIIF-interacting CTD phosphatase-like protein
LFSNKKTTEKLQAIVNNDPVLKKLQSDLRNIHDKATDYLDTVKKEEPEIYQYLQKNGFIK